MASQIRVNDSMQSSTDLKYMTIKSGEIFSQTTLGVVESAAKKESTSLNAKII